MQDEPSGIMNGTAAAAKPRGGRVILKMSVQLPDGQKGASRSHRLASRLPLTATAIPQV